MKKTAKHFLLAMVLALGVGLSGCGAQDQETESEQPADEQQGAPDVETEDGDAGEDDTSEEVASGVDLSAKPGSLATIPAEDLTYDEMYDQSFMYVDLNFDASELRYLCELRKSNDDRADLIETLREKIGIVSDTGFQGDGPGTMRSFDATHHALEDHCRDL